MFHSTYIPAASPSAVSDWLNALKHPVSVKEPALNVRLDSIVAVGESRDSLLVVAHTWATMPNPGPYHGTGGAIHTDVAQEHLEPSINLSEE